MRKCLILLRTRSLAIIALHIIQRKIENVNLDSKICFTRLIILRLSHKRIKSKIKLVK